MKIVKFKQMRKNSLRGFIEAELPSGMCLRDLTYHVHEDGRRWIGYPSRQYERDGKTEYMNLVYFPDKEVHRKFQEKLLAALDQYLAQAGGDEEVPF